jgi:hypothetical protein
MAITVGKEPWNVACDSYGKVRHSRKACIYTTVKTPTGDLIVTIAARIPNWDDAKIMAKAPQTHDAARAMLAALKECQPALIRLGDFIGNKHDGSNGIGAFDRCAIIGRCLDAMRAAEAAGITPKDA